MGRASSCVLQPSIVRPKRSGISPSASHRITLRYVPSCYVTSRHVKPWTYVNHTGSQHVTLRRVTSRCGTSNHLTHPHTRTETFRRILGVILGHHASALWWPILGVMLALWAHLGRYVRPAWRYVGPCGPFLTAAMTAAPQKSCKV